MNSNLYISGTASMHGNTATTYAPGIYNSGNIYVEGEANAENGVYIENRAAVLEITNDLLTNSVIQIDNSGYVTPDESLAPIVVAVASSTHPELTLADLQAFRKPTTGFENWRLKLAENNTQIVLVPEEYTITYTNLHGATHTNPTTYTAGTPTFTLTDPTYIKCRYFVGWFDENGRKVTQIVQGTTGNLVLSARWDSIGKCQIGYICAPNKNSKYPKNNTSIKKYS